MRKRIRSYLLLLLAAMIWGAAFVAQSDGMDYMQPLSFNGMRQILAGLALLPVVCFADRKGIGKKPVTSKAKKTQFIAEVCCGTCLFLSTNAQQMGLQTTQPGKAGFITALYVVLVPVAYLICFRKSAGWLVWIGVVLAVCGLWLLCWDPAEKGISSGDLLVAVCALCFTVHILVIDHFSPVVDPVRLSRGQFLISGILSVGISLFTETITADGIRGSLIPMLYAGLLSGAVGYTLQIIAQKDTDPTVASLIMCLESVFAVIFGALLAGETMTGREGLGCVIMFAAVILAQLSPVLCKKNEIHEKRGICMKKLVSLFLLLLVLFSAACAESPFVYGYDLKINEITEDVFSGNTLTVVNVWGTFCGPCIEEMPYLGQLSAEYGDLGVRFIGIVCDVGNDAEALEKAKSIVDSTGADYLQLIPNEYLWYRFCVQSDYIPASFILDSEGNPLTEEPIVGSMSYAAWKATIDSYLGAQQ